MNYYEHHIGDYDADTAHLSWAEDMAYTRLIRLYYRRERPIPADLTEACRLVRASSREQKQAVDAVLREFFVLQEDGWHQARCDAEVEKYQQRVAHNQRVGRLGGRPKKEKPANNPPGFLRVSENNPPQTPDPIPHTPVNSVTDVTGGKPPKSPTDDEKSRLWANLKTALVGESTCPDLKQAGVLLGKAASKYGQDVFLDACRETVTEVRANTHTYLIAACERAAGRRVPPNRQEAIEQRNRATADEWLREGETHAAI